MDHNREKPGENRTSRIAAGITIAILLCLFLAGGVFVLFRKPSAKNTSENGSGSSASDASSKSFADSAREWLGIDTILSILDIGDGYTVVKADPSVTADPASDEEGTGSPSGNKAKKSAGTSAAGKAAKSGQKSSENAKKGQADQNTSTDTKNSLQNQASPAADKAAAGKAAKTGTDPAAGSSSPAADSGEPAAAMDAEAVKKETAQKKAKEEETKDKKSNSPTKLQKKYVAAWEDWHMRDFPGNYPLHNYNWKYLSRDESGVLRYEGDENYMIRRGIDVSEFQGKIDWEKVRKDGFDFVFVRVGHRTMHTGDLQRDSRAIKNLTRAKKAGLDVGAYIFSQAVTEKEAQKEAQLCLDVIEESGVELTLPIVFDPEIVIEDYNARINYISGEQFTDNAVAFCEKIKKAGYTPAIYANCSTETDILDMSRLKDAVIWYADYSSTPETPYDFTFWQYSNLGWVDGIPETETDLNVWFIRK